MGASDRNRDRSRLTARVGFGMGYIGDGNYSSGEYGGDAPPDYDYGYAGFKGDAGIDEYGDNQYGGGRYGQGPFEQSQQYGAEGFSSRQGPYGTLQRQFENTEGRHVLRPLAYDDSPARFRGYTGFSAQQHEGFGRSEITGTSDWRSAPDFADPAGYQIISADDRPLKRRGPKNYRRSDHRILEDIYEHLLPHEHLDTSDVSIEVHDGRVTLTGTVPERRMKYFIEDLVHVIRDVREVDNTLRVQRAGGIRS
jgi:hypothetical protein